MAFDIFRLLTILSLISILTTCSAPPATPQPAPLPLSQSTPETNSPTPAEISSPSLPVDATWQIQYAGKLDLSLDVDVYNLDLFEVTPEDIDRLHARGIYVMCYFSAGSWEDWRPDADQFPAEIIGNDYQGWPGENWLDIRDIQALKPTIESRLEHAAKKGCDGVDPDNVNGFENETGFPISYADQLDFNIWLSQTAHAHQLNIGLKNDLDQITDLLPYFDWVLNEECFSYRECERLSPFFEAGKPVFVIEYETLPAEFCPTAKELGFNMIHKNWELDAYREACP
jgi:hypothetical protein